MNNASITTSPPRACQGFSLFEVLVTVVVVGIGLLGLAGLQFAGLRASNNAQDATYATQLAQEVAERIRANRAGAINGNYSGLTLRGSSSPTMPSCGGPNMLACTFPFEMRNYDIYQLVQRLGANDGNPPILANGAISIISNDNIIFTIGVFWGNPSTTVPTACPAAGWQCVTLRTSISSICQPAPC